MSINVHGPELVKLWHLLLQYLHVYSEVAPKY